MSDESEVIKEKLMIIIKNKGKNFPCLELGVCSSDNCPIYQECFPFSSNYLNLKNTSKEWHDEVYEMAICKFIELFGKEELFKELI
jgi:hypothetical protein